jgi:hypothetical protein
MGLQSDKITETSNDPPVDSAPQPAPVKTVHRLGQRASRFASVLVVALLVIASLLLFRHYSTAIVSNIPTGNHAGFPVGTPVVSHTNVGGLETTFSITPGPYFLSELLAVDITLTNHSQKDIMLGGSTGINTCNGAFSVAITRGEEPHYDLPGNNFMMSCPPGMTALDLKKSLTVHGYIPLTKSGAVAVTTEVRVAIATRDQNGVTNISGNSSLDGRVAITVSPQIPSDRLISLQTQGNDVIVNAPAAVRPHLVYFYTVSCAHGSGTNDGWDPLKSTTLHEPYCDDFLRHWIYAVSAPGYAIAAISMGF